MAIIKEKGTIAVLGEVQSGVSQSGNTWHRQTIVVDVAGYNGSYRKVALQASGNVVRDLETAMVGDKVEVSYQVTAREYQGRWYNNVDLFKVEIEMTDMPAASQMGYTSPAIPLPPHENPQYQQMPQVNPQMYQQPAAPAAPARRGRPAMPTQPLIQPNMPMDLQEDDLPAAFYQHQ